MDGWPCLQIKDLDNGGLGVFSPTFVYRQEHIVDYLDVMILNLSTYLVYHKDEPSSGPFLHASPLSVTICRRLIHICTTI